MSPPIDESLVRLEQDIAGHIAPPDMPDAFIHRRDGTVLTVNANGTADVIVGGVVIPGVTHKAWYAPMEGDEVFVEFVDTNVVIDGPTGSMPRWPNEIEATTTASGTLSSTSLSDWPSGGVLTFPWRKRLADTEVLVQIVAGGYASTTTTTTDIGVRFDTGGVAGVTQIVRRFNHNLASLHLDFVGTRRLAGIPAGLHSVRLRAQLVTPSRTFNCDAVDRQSVMVREIPPPLQT